MSSDFAALLPVVFPAIAGLAIMVLCPKGSATGARPLPPMLALGGLAASLISIWALWGKEARDIYGGAARADDFGLVIALGSILCAAATVVLGVDYLKRHGRNHPEFHVLILFLTAAILTIIIVDTKKDSRLHK